MRHAPIGRKSVNLSLDAKLIDEAKALGINMSRSAEAGIRAAVKSEKERQWLEENRGALESWNRWTRDNPLPLEDAVLF
jgi:antitoxin CcdA